MVVSYGLVATYGSSVDMSVALVVYGTGTEVVNLDGFCWLLEGAGISSGERKQTSGVSFHANNLSYVASETASTLHYLCNHMK